jgi:hypothetical protein
VRLQSIYRARTLGLFGLISVACSKHDAPPSQEIHVAYVRGDRVVVEQAAAEFFEGRVLAVAANHLRIQAAGGNDSLSVAASDVYRLPPAPDARGLLPRALAICNFDDAWLPCRVQKVNDTTLSVTSATGEAFDLNLERVLTPTLLTELNLRSYFVRNEAVLAFSRSARRAGDPRPEPGWHPSLRERVLVKLGSDWFTGYVHDLGDDRAGMMLDAGQRSVTVPLSALAAEPPSSVPSELRHGDFVLVRPETSSEPWARWEVHAVNGPEIELIDATGRLKAATVRDLLLLRP